MKKFENALRISFYIFSGMNGWDSALIIGMLSFGATMSTFDSYWFSLATAIFTTGAMVYVIDVVSTIGMLPTMEAYKRGGSQAIKRQYLIVFAYLVLLSGISLGISIYGRDFITEVVIPTPSPVNTSTDINAVNTNHTTTLATYDKTISDAERERRKAEKNAGSPWLRMMADKRNKAAISALNEAKKKAGTEYTATIQAAQNAKLQALQGKESQIAQIQSQAIARDAMALESTINKRHLISGFLMWIAIGSLAMMWITALTIVALDASDGELDGAIGNDGEYTPPPHSTNPRQRTSNLNTSTYTPAWYSSTNKKPVITNEAVVITNELEDLDIERDNDTNCITAIKQGGVPMDRTKMNEFFLTYKKRAEDSSKDYKTRTRNYVRAQELNMALFTIHGVDRRHVVAPTKPQTWEQQNLFAEN